MSSALLEGVTSPNGPSSSRPAKRLPLCAALALLLSSGACKETSSGDLAASSAPDSQPTVSSGEAQPQPQAPPSPLPEPTGLDDGPLQPIAGRWIGDVEATSKLAAGDQRNLSDDFLKRVGSMTVQLDGETMLYQSLGIALLSGYRLVSSDPDSDSDSDSDSASRTWILVPTEGPRAGAKIRFSVLATGQITMRELDRSDPAVVLRRASLSAGAASPRRRSASSGPNNGAGYSNIYPRDYVGPAVCAECHPKNYELWRQHPHRKMTQDVSPASVLGDFSGTRVSYADGSVVFAKQGKEFTMTLFRQSKLVRRYRVTRTIGSRIIQMYIGVQTEGPEPREDTLVYRNETKLPFAYWVQHKRWFPETYDELPKTTEYDEAGRLTRAYDIFNRRGEGSMHWRANCIRCHNTYPYLYRLRPGTRAGFPAGDIVMTKGLPEGGYDQHGYPLLQPEQLVSLGISCETCHFGGREHSFEDREIRFLPSGDGLSFPKATPQLIDQARESPYVINSICAQCHSALTNGPNYPTGAGIWNSREALDMAAGGCASQIKCTDCHNPHQAGPKSGGGPDQQAHIDACLGCHGKYRAPAAAAAHSRHAGEAKVSCLDCHMPRIVHGLQDVLRTHHISSPTDPRMLERGAPNACNLCHLDRPIRWTLQILKRQWSREIVADSSWAYWYGGSLEKPVGQAWLKHPYSVVRLVAADAYSRSPPGKRALVEVLSILDDVRPPNRALGLFIVERMLGREISEDEYSPSALPSRRAKQLAALIAAQREP